MFTQPAPISLSPPLTPPSWQWPSQSHGEGFGGSDEQLSRHKVSPNGAEGLSARFQEVLSRGRPVDSIDELDMLASSARSNVSFSSPLPTDISRQNDSVFSVQLADAQTIVTLRREVVVATATAADAQRQVQALAQQATIDRNEFQTRLQGLADFVGTQLGRGQQELETRLDDELRRVQGHSRMSMSPAKYSGCQQSSPAIYSTSSLPAFPAGDDQPRDHAVRSEVQDIKMQELEGRLTTQIATLQEQFSKQLMTCVTTLEDQLGTSMFKERARKCSKGTIASVSKVLDIDGKQSRCACFEEWSNLVKDLRKRTTQESIQRVEEGQASIVASMSTLRGSTQLSEESRKIEGQRTQISIQCLNEALMEEKTRRARAVSRAIIRLYSTWFAADANALLRVCWGCWAALLEDVKQIKATSERCRVDAKLKRHHEQLLVERVARFESSRQTFAFFCEAVGALKTLCFVAWSTMAKHTKKQVGAAECHRLAEAMTRLDESVLHERHVRVQELSLVHSTLEQGLRDVDIKVATRLTDHVDSRISTLTQNLEDKVVRLGDFEDRVRSIELAWAKIKDHYPVLFTEIDSPSGLHYRPQLRNGRERGSLNPTSPTSPFALSSSSSAMGRY